MKTIDGILEKRRIIITCGTGGVGKTTVSAALAMRAALMGKKTAVITIDPAKRLATSLGLSHLSDRPIDLTEYLYQALTRARTQGADSGMPASFSGGAPGRFVALMPDAKRNFEDFLGELAPSEELVQRVMKNPIFQIFTKEFSGTNEYMALERLQALDRLGEYDCIILDTPPSRNALAFLNAPKLVSELFEQHLVRRLLVPTNKLVSAGMRKALGVLERLTGAGFMTNLFDFASTLFEVRVQFMANFEKTTKLLESEAVGFIMVTAPTPDAAPEVEHFITNLRKHGFHFDGLTVNRTLGHLEIPEDASPAHTVLRAVQKREAKALKALAGGTAPIIARVPELARDVHSVEDLFHVALALDTDRRR